MFGKVLIANRGEIALRTMRTCARLGVRTVAVYSDADRDAPHVLAADEAVRLGPAEPSESYLSIERILDAARQTGAEALHPGYGFLSERPEFADACAEAGIVFVGPTAAAMRRLGDKIGARHLAEQHGVPVAPGYDGDDQRPERLLAEAKRIGFPLLVKASAGGGGRGMREVDKLENLPAALAAARGEVELAFGDGRAFLERLIFHARHVEVQIIGDQYGKVIALGDRDCSLQRRHQKLVEEAPAPNLPDALRAAMHVAAVRLAQAAGYTNAGTVEFLVQGDRFYFLEVNARLQVEHTVTEEVTGLDLVEIQLRLAAGQPVAESPGLMTSTPHAARSTQRSPGHALEARIYAEDPANDFLPSAGAVRRLRWPAGPGVRVDAGITAAGQQVGASYDPLLGKIICCGVDRDDALRCLDAALVKTVVLGVPSTAGFLRRVVATPEFRTGGVSTDFLAEHPELMAAAQPPSEVLAAATCATLAGPFPWRALAGWRQGSPRTAIRLAVGGGWQTALPAAAPWSDCYAVPPVTIPVRAEDGRPGVEVSFEGSRWQVWLDVPLAPPVDPQRVALPEGASAESVAEERPSKPGRWFAVAPLSGRAGARLVEAGAIVDANATLTSIEAMKMQHAIVATRRARLVRWLVEPGAFVRAGQPLVELAPPVEEA